MEKFYAGYISLKNNNNLMLGQLNVIADLQEIKEQIKFIELVIKDNPFSLNEELTQKNITSLEDLIKILSLFQNKYCELSINME